MDISKTTNRSQELPHLSSRTQSKNPDSVKIEMIEKMSNESEEEESSSNGVEEEEKSEEEAQDSEESACEDENDDNDSEAERADDEKNTVVEISPKGRFKRVSKN